MPDAFDIFFRTRKAFDLGIFEDFRAITFPQTSNSMPVDCQPECVDVAADSETVFVHINFESLTRFTFLHGN